MGTKMPNSRSQFSEQVRTRVKAAQLAHGIKWQGPVMFVGSVAWIILIILLANGASA